MKVTDEMLDAAIYAYEHDCPVLAGGRMHDYVCGQGLRAAIQAALDAMPSSCPCGESCALPRQVFWPERSTSVRVPTSRPSPISSASEIPALGLRRETAC